jgi:hypothetical protein
MQETETHVYFELSIAVINSVVNIEDGVVEIVLWIHCSLHVVCRFVILIFLFQSLKALIESESWLI